MDVSTINYILFVTIFSLIAIIGCLENKPILKTEIWDPDCSGKLL